MQVWRAAARELVEDNVAIVRSDDDRRVTYRELKEAAVAYAADWAGAFGFDVGGSLEERGRGKAVGVMALPGAEYCAAMLAVWRLGWIAVPLSPSHPIGELTHAIREARVEIVFVTDNLLDKVADLGSLCPVRALRYIDDVPRDLDTASRDDFVLEQDGPIRMHRHGGRMYAAWLACMRSSPYDDAADRHCIVGGAEHTKFRLERLKGVQPLETPVIRP